MNYQSKGWQVSLLIHAAVFSLVISANISESRLTMPVVIDFSIVRDAEEIAPMPGPGDSGLPPAQGEKTENRVVDNMPDQPVTETPPVPPQPVPPPPVPQKKKELPVRTEKRQKPKEPEKKTARAERKKSPPAKPPAEKREDIPAAKQVQTKGDAPATVQAEENVKENKESLASDIPNADAKSNAPLASDAPHSDAEDRHPEQSAAENSAAAKSSGASDSKVRNSVAGYAKAGSGRGGNGFSDNLTFGSGAGAPKLGYKAKAVYPAFARRLGKQGKVVLRLTIDEKGNLVNVEVIEDAGYGFAEAAIAAVKKSTFIPATFNGKPVKSRALLPMKFALE